VIEFIRWSGGVAAFLSVVTMNTAAHRWVSRPKGTYAVEPKSDAVDSGGDAVARHTIYGIVALATPKGVKVGGKVHGPDKKGLTKWR
jgi:hypothetical protein